MSDRSRREADLAAYYDQEAAQRAQRALDPLRVERRAQYLALLAAEGRHRLVEVGTGPGRDARAFLEAGYHVSGVDLSAAHVQLARDIGVDAHVASVLDLPFADGAFDAGWTMSTLLHVPNDLIDGAVAEIRRVLQPGAPLAIGLWGSPEGSDIEEVLEMDTIEPKRFFSRRSNATLRSILSRHGTIERFDMWPGPAPTWGYQYVILRMS